MIETLVVALLALPVAAIIGIIMAIGTRDRLRELEQRFGALELRLEPGCVRGAGGETPAAGGAGDRSCARARAAHTPLGAGDTHAGAAGCAGADQTNNRASRRAGS